MSAGKTVQIGFAWTVIFIGAVLIASALTETFDAAMLAAGIVIMIVGWVLLGLVTD